MGCLPHNDSREFMHVPRVEATPVGNVVVLYRPKPAEENRHEERSANPVNVALGSL